MIGLLVLALGVSEPQSTVVRGCETEAPIRNPAICEPLYEDGTVVIYNMESVAVGCTAEMQRIREMTRHCDVDNRIDHVGMIDVAVYDIINANETSRACVIGWITNNAPNLVFSQKRFDRRSESAPPIVESALTK